MLHVRPTRTSNHPEFLLCVSVCVKHSLVTLVVWRHNDSEKTPFVHICLYVTYTNKNLVNCSTNELRPYTHKTKFTKRVYTVHSWIKMVSRMTHRRFHVMYRHMNFRVHTPNPDKYPDKNDFLVSPQTIWTSVLRTPMYMTVLDGFDEKSRVPNHTVE